MNEPTRVFGNASTIAGAAGAALATTLPPPWNIIAGGIGALVSIILTEINRSKVTPCPPEAAK